MATQRSSEPGAINAETPVWRLMTRAVARISSDASLGELARKLSAVEVGAMAVSTTGSPAGTDSLAGIVSERDLTRALGLADEPGALLVSDIVSENLIWCAPDMSAIDAAQLMVERGIRHLMVGTESTGDLQGIVSARDLMKALIGPRTPEGDVQP